MLPGVLTRNYRAHAQKRELEDPQGVNVMALGTELHTHARGRL